MLNWVAEKGCGTAILLGLASAIFPPFAAIATGAFCVSVIAFVLKFIIEPKDKD